MKTRVLSMILAIAMLFSLVIPAFAEEVESFAAEEPAAAEPVYEAPSVAAEPVQEIIPPAEEPVQEIVLSAEEPTQETVSLIDDSIQNAGPVTEEPAQEFIPEEEPAQETTLATEEPLQEAVEYEGEPQGGVIPEEEEPIYEAETAENIAVEQEEEISEDENANESSEIAAFGTEVTTDSISSSAPVSVYATAFETQLTLNITDALAEEGYSYGLEFSNNESGSPSWRQPRVQEGFTWSHEGGENIVKENFYVPDMVPGRTTYYRAYLRDRNGTIIFTEDSYKSVTTSNADVETISLDEIVTIGADTRFIYQITPGASGRYLISTDANPDTDYIVIYHGQAGHQLGSGTGTITINFGAPEMSIYISGYSRSGATFSVKRPPNAEDYSIETIALTDQYNELGSTHAYFSVSYGAPTPDEGTDYGFGVYFIPVSEAGEDFAGGDAWFDLSNYGDVADSGRTEGVPNGTRLTFRNEEDASAPNNTLLPNTEYYYQAHLEVYDQATGNFPIRLFGELRRFTTKDLEIPETDSISSSEPMEGTVTGTAFDVQLSVDITEELAEAGYGFGVEYTPVSQGDNWRQQGTGHSGPGHYDEPFTIADLAPGKTYYYRAFIGDADRNIIFREETIHEVTMDPDDVTEISLDQAVTLPAGSRFSYYVTLGPKGLYRIVSDADYVVVNHGGPGHEIGRGSGVVDFNAGADGMPVYITGYNSTEGATLTVSRKTNADDYSVETIELTDQHNELGSTHAYFSVSYGAPTPDEGTDYGVGVYFIPVSEAGEGFAGGDAWFDLNDYGNVADIGRTEGAPKGTRFSFRDEGNSDAPNNNLQPNTEYYYQAHLEVYDQATGNFPIQLFGELRRFTTKPSTAVQINLNEPIAAEQGATGTLVFTAPATDVYAAVLEGPGWINITSDEEGYQGIHGYGSDTGKVTVGFALEQGETIYIQFQSNTATTIRVTEALGTIEKITTTKALAVADGIMVSFTAPSDGYYYININNTQIDLWQNGWKQSRNGVAAVHMAKGETVYFCARYDMSSGWRNATVQKYTPAKDYSVDTQSINATAGSAIFALKFGAPVPEDGWGYNVGVRFYPVSELPSGFAGGDEWNNGYFQWRAITGIYDPAPAGTEITLVEPNLLPGTEYFAQAYISVYEDNNGENNYQIYGTLKRFTTETATGEVSFALADDGNYHASIPAGGAQHVLQFTIPDNPHDMYIVEFPYGELGVIEPTGVVHPTEYDGSVVFMRGNAMAGKVYTINVMATRAPEEEIDVVIYPLDAEELSMGSNTGLTPNALYKYTPDSSAEYNYITADSNYFLWYDEYNNSGFTSSTIYRLAWYQEAGYPLFFRVRGNGITVEKAPEEDQITAVRATETGATTARLEISYNITTKTVQNRYFVGVVFSTDPAALELDEHGYPLTDRAICWDFDISSPYTIVGSLTRERYLDQLVPGKTYYCKAFIRDNISGMVTAVSDVAEFETVNEVVTALALGEPAALPKGQHLGFSFRAEQDGIYSVRTENAEFISVYNENGGWVSSSMDQEGPAYHVTFYLDAGATVYIFSRSEAENGSTLTVAYESAPATENTISASDPTKFGNTWVDFDLLLSITPETAKTGYHFGVEASIYPDFTNPNGDPDNWNWVDYSESVRLNETVHFANDDLVPGATYYYRAVILDENEETLYKEETVHQFTTQNSGDGIISLMLNTEGILPIGRYNGSFTSATGGIYTIAAEGPDYVNINGSDGRGISGEGNETHSYRLSFLMQPGETVYISGYNNREGATLGIYDGALMADEIVVSVPVTLRDNQVVQFTAPAEGWYKVSVDMAENRWFHVLEGTNWQYCEGGVYTHKFAAGETAFFICWDQNQREMTILAEEFVLPTENEIASFALRDTGNTSAEFTAELKITEETAASGYYVTIGYTAEGSDEALYWHAMERYEPLNEEHITLHLGTLVPGVTYHAKAYIMDRNSWNDGPEAAKRAESSESVTFTTAAGTDNLPILTMGETVTVPEGHTVYRFTAPEDGFYEMTAAGVRWDKRIVNADGTLKQILFGEEKGNTLKLRFSADAGELLYIIMGTDANGGTVLIEKYSEGAVLKEQLAYAAEHPNEDFIFTVERDTELTGTVTIPKNAGLEIRATLTLQPGAQVFAHGSIGIWDGASLVVAQGASLSMMDDRALYLYGGSMHVYGALNPVEYPSPYIYVYAVDYASWADAAAAVAEAPGRNVRMVFDVTSVTELTAAAEFASEHGYGAASYNIDGFRLDSTMLPGHTVPEKVSLYLRGGAELVIPEGATLTVKGSVVPQEGSVVNNGTLQLYGYIVQFDEGQPLVNNGIINIYGVNSVGPFGSIQNEGTINLLGGTIYEMVTITGNGIFNDLNNASELIAVLKGYDTESGTYIDTEKLQSGQPGRIVLRTKSGSEVSSELFTYESSDEAIAAVNDKGEITVPDGAEGSVTVHITVKGASRGIDVTVEVEKPDDEPITLETGEDIIQTEQGYLLSKIYQPEGVIGAEYSLKPLDSDLKKGMYKYTATDTKVAAVKENADGTATVTLKGLGETAITIAPAAKTDSRTPVTVTVRVRDYTPRLGETAVTLNPKLDMEATLPLTAADGSSITDVELTTTAPITCEYADGQLVFTATGDSNVADKKAVLTVNVEVKENGTTETYSYISDGKNFPYLSVTTKGTEPSITVKQTGKINTFYMDSETTLTVTAKNEEIESINVAENPTYKIIGSYGDVITLGIRGDYETLDTKNVDLKIYLAGYKEPVTKTVAISAERKGPTLTVSPASGTIDPTKGENEIALTIFNKTTGQDIDVGKLVEPYIASVDFVTAAERDEDTNTIRLTLNKSQLGKGGTVKIGIREAVDTERSTGWTTPVEVSYKIAVKTVATPKLKLGATTLTVSNTFNENVAGTSFGTDVADIPVIGMNAEYAGKDAAEAEKLDLWLENGMLKAAVNDQSIKTGSYKYNIVADTEYAEGLKATVTVKVADTMPKVSFAKASLTLNANLAGRETAGTQVKLSTKSGYSVVGFSGIDESADLDFDYDVDSATLYVKLKHGTAGKYSWALTPLVEDDVTGQTEEGKAITLTVTSAAKTASVKAAGKGSIELIARSGSGITYTPTLTNAMGTVTGAYLPNEADRALFTLSSDVNEKGTAVAVLRLKDEATVDVKAKYPVTIAFEVDYGAYELPTTVTPTLKQSTAKFGKTAVATVFQGTANPTATYEVTITGPEGAAISNIAMDSKSMAANLKNAIKGITWSADGASATVIVSFKNMATLKSGSTYKIPLIVTPAGSGAITKANVTMSFKVNR